MKKICIVLCIFLCSAVCSLYADNSSIIGIVNADKLRIRQEPSLQGAELGFIHKGDIVTVMARSAEKMKIGSMDNYWYKIRTKAGIVGWSYGYFIDVPDEKQIPVAIPASLNVLNYHVVYEAADERADTVFIHNGYAYVRGKELRVLDIKNP